ncbi:hypothetical protein [Plantactinospora sp. GCM10030261]|uniref:hypothetical protein n=1 Tax=Plantactinospora sp. GCM10030261 TaxID=3273420 RepID=UPI00360DD904
MLDALTVEEWAEPTGVVVSDGDDTLALENTAGKPVDESTLGRRLARIDGVERIRSLVVGPDSRLRDLRFLAALPHLRTVEVYGLRVRTLAGLRRDTPWDYVKVDTDRNRRRSLAELAGTPIRRLAVRWGDEVDLTAIGACRDVVDLELSAWPEPSLGELRNLPLQYLAFVSGRFTEVGDTAAVPTLRRLRVVDCRTLQRFTGDNGNVTWLTVWSCHRLDVQTVATFSRVETVELSSQRQPVPLSAFQRLRALQALVVDDATALPDVIDIKRDATRLTDIVVSEFGNEQLRELSRANPAVTVTNGVAAFRDGRPTEMSGE